MAVEVKSGSGFEAGLPKVLFDPRFPFGSAWVEVSKDGRFLIPVQLEHAANAPMAVVVNWPAAFKK